MQASVLDSDKRIHPNSGLGSALRTSATMLPSSEPRSNLRASTTMLAPAAGTGYMRPQRTSQPPAAAAPRNIAPIPTPISQASSSYLVTTSDQSVTTSPAAPVAAFVPVSSVPSSSPLGHEIRSTSPTPSPNSGRKHLFVAETSAVTPTPATPSCMVANEPQKDAPMDVDAIPEAAPTDHPGATATRPQDNDKADPPFMASLLKLPDLYALSRPDLEALVAEVIREEEFVKLVSQVLRFCMTYVVCSCAHIVVARRPGLDVASQGSLGLRTRN